MELPRSPHPADPGAAAQLILQGPAVAADLGETGGSRTRTDPQAAGLADDPGHQRRGTATTARSGGSGQQARSG